MNMKKTSKRLEMFENEMELKDYLKERIMNDGSRWHTRKDLSTSFSFMCGNHQLDLLINNDDDIEVAFERFIELVNEVHQELEGE
jgi:hypothetical protein